jgi:hypothetical protein
MRLSQIDASNRDAHARLHEDDRCYYVYEYTSGKNYAFSATNQLIANLKKKPTSPANQLHYKTKAVGQCADTLRAVMNSDWLQSATLVPVPGSKAAGDPEFDNRMERIARGIGPGLDVRSIVRQRESTLAAHEAQPGQRVTVEQLLDLYEIDEALAQPVPTHIGVLDDVLTAGTHFRAMRITLEQRFPGVPVVGLFIARRVFPLEVEDFDVL